MLKNIIFDFGGVIIPLDYNKTFTAFEQLGAKNILEFFSQKKQTELFDLLDKGKLSPADFRNRFNQLFDLNLTAEEFDTAWNAMLLDIPQKNIDFLKKLKNKYPLYLLSNTNAIHIDYINKRLKGINGVDDWKSLFTKTYYSFEIGMRKPDKEIFETVIAENNLNLSETLYIEDSEKNLEAAISIDLPAYTFPMNGDITKELDFLLKVKL